MTQLHTLQRLQENRMNAQMDTVTDTVANEMYFPRRLLSVCVCISFCAEATSYFLYNLIGSMSGGQVQAQEDKLRSFFNQLQAQVQTSHTELCVPCISSCFRLTLMQYEAVYHWTLEIVLPKLYFYFVQVFTWLFKIHILSLEIKESDWKKSEKSKR